MFRIPGKQSMRLSLNGFSSFSQQKILPAALANTHCIVFRILYNVPVDIITIASTDFIIEAKQIFSY